MSNNNTFRTELTVRAQQIEDLARAVRVALASNGDVLAVANELARNSSTFVFTLGGLFALEEVGTGKQVKATTVKAGNRNYHNVRDSLGRFTKV